jgi:hypothetical protein
MRDKGKLMADDPVTECLAAWRTLIEGINGLATERTPISTAVPRLLAAVDAVLEHHRPVQLYDRVEDYRGKITCGHDRDYDGDLHYEGDDGLWYCRTRPTVTVCACCSDEADADLRAEWPCPTYAGIARELTGEASDGQAGPRGN